MKRFAFLALCLLLCIGLTSCTGDTGPAGVDGTDGADGIDGADGADGRDGVDGEDGFDGQDGNANVIFSDWFAPTWTVPSTFAAFVHPVPDITQEILDTGVVLVYADMFNHIYPLPISFIGDGNPKEFNFWLDLGALRIWFTAETDLTPDPDTRFRYILIPGSTAIAKSANPRQAIYNELEAAGVEIDDFASVCAYYGLNLY
jgi:Collagen triple helix repeat (20 copies)